MDNRIRPNVVHPLKVDNSELYLSPSHDSVHVFKWLGMAVVKYFDQNEGNMKNIWLPEESTDAFLELGFLVGERETITVEEYNQYLDVSAINLDHYYNENWDE